MPWKSLKQERWGNSPSGREAMGQKAVNEFNQASKGTKLPLHKRPLVSLNKKESGNMKGLK